MTNRLLVGCFLTLLVAIPVSGIAETASYSTRPIWFSESANMTRSTVFSDIDLDGDLDLVCGNDGESNTLYLNNGDGLSPTPVWESADVNATFAVVAGDVNGDGWVDLVFGNYGQENTLYLNNGGTFSIDPTWRSETANKTTSAVLGDVDGDGKLDLVCGNDGESNTLYSNNGDGFSLAPVWESADVNATFAVAIGDVDGDGWLDLVCGNDGESNTLFLNSGGDFLTAPHWVSTWRNRTFSVALGDVDGDGWFDLICGNVNEENTLYSNTGEAGVFSAISNWSSSLNSATVSVALDDADGDGDVDLMCGNYGQPKTLYQNIEGVLNTLPCWNSDPPFNGTLNIALGDVDGDGDVDLVCANGGDIGENNTLYLNQATLLSESPTWESFQKNSSFAVALGDVNDDGALDLVCGNGRLISQTNTLYLNQGEGLNTIPDWESDSTYTQSIGVALGDVDGDTLLDVVFGNIAQPNTLYLNNGPPTKIPATTAHWTSDPELTTAGVALGDVDADGRLDLVFGNGGTVDQKNTLYLSTGQANVFRTIPDWESTVASATIGVALGDVDGDGYADLVCGNNSAQANTLYLSRGGVMDTDPAWESGLTKDTFGVTLGDVDGDGNLDLVCATGGTGDQANTLYLNRSDEGAPFDSTVFSFTPDWEAGLDKSTTFGVALGDVDADGDLDLFCGNGGTDFERNTLYLNISGSETFTTFPVWFSAASNASFGVAVGDVDRDGDLDAVFANEGESNTMYEGKRNPVFKGDPLDPTNHLPNNGPVLRGIEVTRLTGILYKVRFRVLDVEADPVWILPEYQFEGSPEWIEAAFHEQPPTPPINELLSTSPGGETYSFEWNISDMPLDDRPVNLRLRAISIPKHVSVTRRISSYVTAIGRTLFIFARAVPDQSGQFPQGDSIRVEVTLPPGVSPVSGRLFYRRGGEPDTAYKGTAILSTTPPAATIPGESVGPRGVEYYVQVPVGDLTLTYPRGTPDNNLPRSIRVSVCAEGVPDGCHGLAEPDKHPGMQYRMISIPLEMRGTITDALSDDLGTWAIHSWRMFTHDPHFGAPASMYVELIQDSIFPFEHGRAYWLITNNPHRVDTGPESGLSTPTENYFPIDLEPGWNMIGNPFNFPTDWSDMLVNDVPAATAVGSLLEGPPLRYVRKAAPGPAPQYVEVGQFDPFAGYWIKNISGGKLTLRVPAMEADGSKAFSSGLTAGDDKDVDVNWRIRLSVSTVGVGDGYNYIGAHSKAETMWDRYDRSEPPVPPGKTVSLYFPHQSWTRHPGHYTIDVRGESELVETTALGFDLAEESLAGYVWYVDVAKSFVDEPPADDVQLVFHDVERIPETFVLILVDRHLGRQIDLRDDNRYVFYLGKRPVVKNDEDARFMLLAGTASFIDSKAELLPSPTLETALRQNYPNPFNPSTLIRYELETAGQMTLEVYDVTGALVRTLYNGHRNAGRYETRWRGVNDRGEVVSSGVYFCRLKTSRFADTKKMLLLR